MSSGFDPIRPPQPFAQTVEQFARDHGMTVKYPSSPEDEARGDYLCQLGFTNASGQLCFLYLDRSRDGWSVRVQRWGLHGLIASKRWDLPHDVDAAALRVTLERARDLVNAPVEDGE